MTKIFLNNNEYNIQSSLLSSWFPRCRMPSFVRWLTRGKTRIWNLRLSCWCQSKTNQSKTLPGSRQWKSNKKAKRSSIKILGFKANYLGMSTMALSKGKQYLFIHFLLNKELRSAPMVYSEWLAWVSYKEIWIKSFIFVISVNILTFKYMD